MKKVSIGSTITVQFDDDDTETFEIVDASQVDVARRKISAEGRFGRAMIGVAERESVSFQNYLDKQITCRVLQIR